MLTNDKFIETLQSKLEKQEIYVGGHTVDDVHVPVAKDATLQERMQAIRKEIALLVGVVAKLQGTTIKAVHAEWLRKGNPITHNMTIGELQEKLMWIRSVKNVEQSRQYYRKKTFS